MPLSSFPSEILSLLVWMVHAAYFNVYVPVCLSIYLSYLGDFTDQLDMITPDLG